MVYEESKDISHRDIKSQEDLCKEYENIRHKYPLSYVEKGKECFDTFMAKVQDDSKDLLFERVDGLESIL